MQISNINSAYGVYKSEQQLSAANKTKKIEKKKDSINLSNEAKEFNIAQGALSKSSSDMRVDKVNKIKEQIANGSYNINSADTAGKLVEDYFAQMKFVDSLYV